MFSPYRHTRLPDGIGLEAEGKSLEQAFERAACALFALMTHPALILPEREVRVEFEEAEPARALGIWLDRLQGQARFANLVLGSFQLTRKGNHYVGLAWGMPWKKGAERGHALGEVASGSVNVEQRGRRWRVRCVIDAPDENPLGHREA